MFLLFLPSLAASLTFHHQSSNTYYFSPFLPDGVKHFKLSAPAYAITDVFSTAWDVAQAADVLRGKIGVLTGEDKDGKWREDYVFRGQELGLVAVVVWTSWVPDHYWEIGRSDFSALRIPCVSMSLSDMRSIQALVEGGNTSMTLDSSDSPNEWTTVFESLFFIILFKAGFCVVSCILVLVASHRLYLWYIYFRACKSYSIVAVLCLSVELVINLERAAYFALGGIGGYPRRPWVLTRIMYTVSLPLTYLTTALTAAYLHEVFTTRAPLGTFVYKTRKPLIALTIFYCLTDWPLSVLSALRVGNSGMLAKISAALLTAGLALTSLLLLFITCRLQSYFNRHHITAALRRKSIGMSGSLMAPSSSSPGPSVLPQNRSSPPPDQMHMLLTRIQRSLYALLLAVVGFVLTLSPLFQFAVGFVCVNAIIFVGLALVSFLHILAYGNTPALLPKCTLPPTRTHRHRPWLSMIPTPTHPRSSSLPCSLSGSLLKGSASRMFTHIHHGPLAVLPEEAPEVEMLRCDAEASLSSKIEEPLSMMAPVGPLGSLLIDYFPDEAEGDPEEDEGDALAIPLDD